jgi:histidyl-tRNA synthetase
LIVSFDYRELGSVCSGGRYENLADYYTDKKLPGVGISIGLTRLFYKLNELNLIKAEKKSVADALVISMVDNMEIPIKIATKLRSQGKKIEVYLNNKKIKAKFKYADKLEIPYVIIIGEDEIANNTVKIKNMQTGEEKEYSQDNIKIDDI